MRRIRTGLALSLLTLAATGGCQRRASDAPVRAVTHIASLHAGPLPGTTWIVDSIDGLPPPPGHIARLTFGIDDIQADGFCNSLYVTYSSTSRTLSAGQASQSLVLCRRDDLDGQRVINEARLDRFVQGVSGFRFASPDTLILTTKNGEEARLHRKPRPIYTIRGLWEYCWPKYGQSALVIFDHGRVAESSGCKGRYILEGHVLKTTFPMVRACLDASPSPSRLRARAMYDDALAQQAEITAVVRQQSRPAPIAPGLALDKALSDEPGFAEPVLPLHPQVQARFVTGASDLATNLANRLEVQSPDGAAWHLCRRSYGALSDPRAEDFHFAQPPSLVGSWVVGGKGPGQPLTLREPVQFDAAGRFRIGTACSGTYWMDGSTLRLRSAGLTACPLDAGSDQSHHLALDGRRVGYQSGGFANLTSGDGGVVTLVRLTPWNLRGQAARLSSTGAPPALLRPGPSIAPAGAAPTLSSRAAGFAGPA